MEQGRNGTAKWEKVEFHMKLERPGEERKRG
jgi:hypothetical protein